MSTLRTLAAPCEIVCMHMCAGVSGEGPWHAGGYSPTKNVRAARLVWNNQTDGGAPDILVVHSLFWCALPLRQVQCS